MPRRPIVIGAVAVIVAMTVAGVAASERSGSRHEPQGNVAFSGEARLVLAPLLQHVRHIPQALKALVADPTPKPALAASGTQWADDCATTRDLLTRLRPSAGRLGEVGKELYRLAAMLYVEAARSVTLAANPPPGGAAEAARSGLRIRLVADRAFDLARKVLEPERPGQGGSPLEQRVMPAEVPDFKLEGLDPDRPGELSEGGTGFADDSPGADPSAGSRVRPLLDAAAATLDQAAALYTDEAGTADRLSLARQLESTSRDLGATDPPSPGHDGLVALRLALLVHAESIRSTMQPAATQQAVRLRLIGERVWSVGVRMAAAGSIGLPNDGAVTAVAAPAALLTEGGAFGGNPPPLRPGDDPAAGVPGGLPRIDPEAILLG